MHFEPIGDLLVFVTESMRKKEEIRGLLQGGPGSIVAENVVLMREQNTVIRNDFFGDEIPEHARIYSSVDKEKCLRRNVTSFSEVTFLRRHFPPIFKRSGSC